MKSKICMRSKLFSFVIIGFLMLFIIACSGGGSDRVIASPFSQSDLTGTWVLHSLAAGIGSRWSYQSATIDSSGNLTFSSCNDSSNSATCPSPGTVTWTINPATGVITASGSGAEPNAYMTMTSNKNFIAGTNGISGGSWAQIRIIQKVTGTTYSSTDLQSQNFVFHQLTSADGTDNAWKYGTGSTDSSGAITISSEATPSGTATPGSIGETMSVDSNGAVTMTGGVGGMDSFNGFLSDDKKTIAGTYTDENGNYNLMIIQITGQTYTPGYLPAGTYNVDNISEFYNGTPISGEVNAFTFYAILSSDGNGNTPYSNVVSNWSLITTWSGGIPLIDATGAIGSSGGTFHGQMSNDGKFIVATCTSQSHQGANNYYSFRVFTQ
jgi:hypothetical protein